MQKIRSIKQLERIIGSRKPAPENGEFVCRIFCPETQEVVILSPRPGSQAYLDFFRIQEEGQPIPFSPATLVFRTEKSFRKACWKILSLIRDDIYPQSLKRFMSFVGDSKQLAPQMAS